MWLPARRSSLLLASSLLCLLPACGGGESTTTQGDEAKDVDYAKLFGVNDPQEDARKASKQMKALEERMAAQKKAAREAEWKSLLITAADAPGDIKTACATMVTRYEAFMDQRVTGVAGERWKATKQADIGKLVEKCQADGNVKVANCEANVFANASAYISEDDVITVITRCEETFGAVQ